ncbi:hypothetical protein TthSNM11_14160 [Thermus thermophilus]|nr:hypothetical protein TthSNM11_14160 [Thermus thermophilus]
MKREDPKDQLKRLFARFTDYLAQSERERAFWPSWWLASRPLQKCPNHLVSRSPLR